MRRQLAAQQRERRVAEAAARRCVAAVCQRVRSRGVPAVQVTRRLGLSARTARRWRQRATTSCVMRRGRPSHCATRQQRNEVIQFLRQRGPATPLAALRAAFPALRRLDLAVLLKRYRQVLRRRAQRRQSRLEWRRAGAVWAADFKERREPLEGRYGWLLSIKDLGSGFQLAWEPLVQATAAAVQAVYTQLFDEHGPPLVLKSDNGGQFKADETKDLLAEYRVLPLYSPKRRPQYNGGVERANGQVASYQEAVAQFHQRPAGPTCDDAEHARRLANELSHPRGWRGPTADQLWDQRAPLTAQERTQFLDAVQAGRTIARAHWNFAPDAALTHDQAAAVDRRAIRDALVQHELLIIHPRRRRDRCRTEPTAPLPTPPQTPIEDSLVSPLGDSPDENSRSLAHAALGAGTIQWSREISPPTVGGDQDPLQNVLQQVQSPCPEETNSSANKSNASGQI